LRVFFKRTAIGEEEGGMGEGIEMRDEIEEMKRGFAVQELWV